MFTVVMRPAWYHRCIPRPPNYELINVLRLNFIQSPLTPPSQSLAQHGEGGDPRLAPGCGAPQPILLGTMLQSLLVVGVHLAFPEGSMDEHVKEF